MFTDWEHGSHLIAPKERATYMGGTVKASPNSAKQTALHLMKNDYAQASELALAMDFATHDWARQVVGVSETWLDWVVRFNSDPLDVRHKARWFVPAFACMSLFDWPAQTFVASIKMQQMVMHLIAEQSFSHADAGMVAHSLESAMDMVIGAKVVTGVEY